MTSSFVRPAAAVALIITIALVGIACGGGSKKTPAVTPGTQAVGLPPLPQDLEPEVYKGDGYYNKRCEDVPSGMNNCIDLLRREAFRDLVTFISQSIDITLKDYSGSKSEGAGADGEMSEVRTYTTEVVREMSADLQLRELESPVLSVNEDTYSIRLLVVRDEVDYTLLTDLAEKAEKDGRKELASGIRDYLDGRFDGKVPSTEQIDSVERLISTHFQDLWKMSGHGDDS